MVSSTEAAILAFSIVLLAFVIAVGALYKFHYPRHLEIDEIVSNEPNFTTPLLGPWRNSWRNSWPNSWTNSWGWLRREKHDQLLPTSHPTSKSSLVNPPPRIENIASSIEVTPTGRPLKYTILSDDLAREVPNASPPHLDRFPNQKNTPWDIQVLVSPEHWRKASKSRKSQPSRGRSTSPYRPSSGVFHSKPIDFPPKERRRERPTFPVPEKLIWKKLTPFERAGMVWYRNAAY